MECGLTSYTVALILDGVHGDQCNSVLDAALQLQGSLLSGLSMGLLIYMLLPVKVGECVGFLQVDWDRGWHPSAPVHKLDISSCMCEHKCAS